MAVLLVSSFVVFVAPAFAGFVWMLNRVSATNGAARTTGAGACVERQGSRRR